MNNQILGSLKDRYKFNEWRGRNRLGKSDLHFSRFNIPNDLLEDLTRIRKEAIEVPGLPGLQRSVWKIPGASASSLVKLNVYQCASREAAHEFLMERLSQAQSAEAYTQSDDKVGDVLFVSSGGRSIFFARANLVIFIALLSDSPVGVTELGAEVDRHLTEAPKQILTRRSPSRHAEGLKVVMRGTGLRRGRIETLVENKETADASRPYSLKLICRNGKFLPGEGGQLELDSDKPGQTGLAMVVVEDDGSTSVKEAESGEFIGEVEE